MRCAAVATVVVLFAGVAQGADDAPKVSGTRSGESLKFPEKGLADGVKAAVVLLESCRDESRIQPNELTEPPRGDHVRLVFAKPITAKIMKEEVEITELMFRLPTCAGVCWARSGDKWRQFDEYEIQKLDPFVAWLRAAGYPMGIRVVHFVAMVGPQWEFLVQNRATGSTYTQLFDEDQKEEGPEPEIDRSSPERKRKP